MAYGPVSESLATTGLGSSGSSANRLPPLLFVLHDRKGRTGVRPCNGLALSQWQGNFSSQLIRITQLIHQVCSDERIEFACQHTVRVRALQGGPVVLDRLVWVQHVAANLVLPFRVGPLFCGAGQFLGP